MMQNLQGKRVAILVDNGFEQVEMTEPRKALNQAGARTELVSPNPGKVKGWNHTEWGDEFQVDVTLNAANANEYDALVLPGGVMNPDKLRMNATAVQFVRSFVQQGKPIAAINLGRGPSVLAAVLTFLLATYLLRPPTHRQVSGLPAYG